MWEFNQYPITIYIPLYTTTTMLSRNELHISIPTDHLYFSGDKIQGEVILSNASNLNISKLTLSFTGREEIKQTKLPSISREEVVFLHVEKILDQKNTIESGTHKYAFEIVLPQLLPPSFSNSKDNLSGRIWYSLSAYLEPSEKSSTTSLETSSVVTVGGSLFSSVENFICPLNVHDNRNLKQGSVDVTIGLNSKVYKAGGDTIFINLAIRNESEQTVSSVVAKLLQCIKFYSNDEIICSDKLELATTDFGGVEGNGKMSSSKSLKVPPETVESVFLKQIPDQCTFGKLIRISYMVIFEY